MESSLLGEMQPFRCLALVRPAKTIQQDSAHPPHETYKNTMKVGPKAQVATLGL